MNNIEFFSHNVDVNAILYVAPGYMYWKDANLRYLGCNRNFLEIINFVDVKQLIGKTDYDLPWGKNPEIVEKYIQDDTNVIEKQSRLITEDHSVIYQSGKKVDIIVQTAKTPLFDNNGNVIGVLGVAINVTDAKEKEKMEQENHAHMIRAEEDERFRKIVGRVAHDIRAPIASTLAIAKSATTLPENMRITLRSAANRINDLANGLLNHFDPNGIKENIEFIVGQKAPLLVSGAIKEILGEKRVQYSDSKILFEENVCPDSYFAFITIEVGSFKRTLSNLINNAIDALDQKQGMVTVGLKLIAEDDLVKVSIRDNGKGMGEELVNKIRNNIDFTEGKKDGHGIGLSQVREMLEHNSGEFAINSTLGVGTEVILTFPAVRAPKWIAEEIKLRTGDILVVLDDDSSIHGAWDVIFANYAENITLKHFEIGLDVINYVNNLPKEQKLKVFLLVDYELLGQEINGLNVVEQTKITRSILVTSHHENKDIQNLASKTKTKILPKLLAPEISITIEKENNGIIPLKYVDLVLLDDDESMTDMLRKTIFKGKNIDIYNDLIEFLNVMQHYPKDTKIVIDNYYENYDGEIADIPVMRAGFGLANRLYKDGYTNLYLYSGDTFKNIPDYLQVIKKSNIEELENLLTTENQKKEKLDLKKQLQDIIESFDSECLYNIRRAQEDILYKTAQLKKRSSLKNKELKRKIKSIEDFAYSARDMFYYRLDTISSARTIMDKAKVLDLLKCDIKANVFSNNLRNALKDNFKLLKNNVKQTFNYMGNVVIVDLILYNLLQYAVYQIRQGHYNTGQIEINTNKRGKMNKLSIKCFAKESIVKHPETDTIYADNYAFCVKAMELFGANISAEIIDVNTIEFILSFTKVING